jgi:hypothetical protein
MHMKTGQTRIPQVARARSGVEDGSAHFIAVIWRGARKQQQV